MRIIFFIFCFLRFIPPLEANLSVHLNLFNTYTQLPYTKENEEKAAEHLGFIYENQESIISKKNKIWLASYYYHQLKMHHDETGGEPLENLAEITQAKRGASILEGLFSSTPQVSLSSEYPLYKLASFYGWLGQSQKQSALLETLYHTQKAEPNEKWSFHARILLSLANAKVKNNQPLDALSLYSEILAMKRVDPFVAGTARLQFARVKFSLLSKEQRTIADPDTIAIVSLLKNLQIQKRLNEEPLHLEASIEYVRICTLLAPEEERELQELALYKRIKDEYTAQDDITSKDYHDNRAAMPEKDSLYQSYMTLFDAHIARLEALKAKKAGNLVEMEWKRDAARTLYSSLLEKKESLTQYLRSQAQQALDAMSLKSKKEEATP